MEKCITRMYRLEPGITGMEAIAVAGGLNAVLRVERSTGHLETQRLETLSMTLQPDVLYIKESLF